MNNPIPKESKTVTGAAIALVAFALVQWGGFQDSEAQMLVLNLMQVGGVLLAWWGRVRLGDVNLLGWRNTGNGN